MIRLSKILTIEVLILLIGISVISPANGINFKEELIEAPEVENLNNQKEIISYIKGTAFEVDKSGYIINEPINITPWKTAIFIIGIKLPSLYSYNLFFYDNPDSIVRASRFIGIAVFAVFNTPWGISAGAPVEPTTATLAGKLFGENGYILTVEIAAALLLASIIGAIVLVREK